MAQAATFSAVVASVNESGKRPKNLEKNGAVLFSFSSQRWEIGKSSN